jgi:hypothetical protein
LADVSFNTTRWASAVLRSGGFDRDSAQLDAEEWRDLVGVGKK